MHFSIPKHGLERDVSSRNEDWRKVYASAKVELDPTTQFDLCQRARQLMQQKLVELASGSGDVEVRNELEEAMRDLWTIEQGIQKPDVQ